MEPITLPAGSIEVMVLQDCTFNGPDHRTLGELHAGDIVLTHESYLTHLREHNLACLSDELGEVEISEAEQELAQLEEDLARAEAAALLSVGGATVSTISDDSVDEDDDESEDAEESSPKVQPKRGRPSKK